MISTTEYKLRYGQLTNTSSSETAAIALGLFEINNAIRYYCATNNGNWWFLEGLTSMPTVADQEAYILPQIVRKVMDTYIRVGNADHSPYFVEDAVMWKRVLQSQLGTGDRPQFVYKQENRLLFRPIPASNGNTIYIRYRKNVKDLSAEDYTTGTVSATITDNTIIGVGTTFTSAMVGRYIRLTSGDYEWYKIASVTDTTHLELEQPYAGITVAGSAFTISEVSLLPEAYQELPLLKAVGKYYEKNNPQIAAVYFQDAENLLQVMLEESREKFEGAYVSPINRLMFRDPNNPQPTIPTSSFT